MIVLYLVLLGLFALLVAWVNAHIDNVVISIYRKSPKHWTRDIIRGVLFGGISLLPFIWTTKDYFLYVLFVTFSFCVFWLYFELTLNNLRGETPYYIGKTATWDKRMKWIFGANNGFLLFEIKIVLITISFGLCIFRYYEQL